MLLSAAVRWLRPWGPALPIPHRAGSLTVPQFEQGISRTYSELRTGRASALYRTAGAVSSSAMTADAALKDSWVVLAHTGVGRHLQPRAGEDMPCLQLPAPQKAWAGCGLASSHSVMHARTQPKLVGFCEQGLAWYPPSSRSSESMSRTPFYCDQALSI